jgi:hypothetical protein
MDNSPFPNGGPASCPPRVPPNHFDGHEMWRTNGFRCCRVGPPHLMPLRVTSSAGHENHPHRTDGHGIPTFTHRQAAIPSGRRGPEAVDLLAGGGEVGSGGRYPGCCVEAISCRGMGPDGQFAVPERRPGLVPATGSPNHFDGHEMWRTNGFRCCRVGPPHLMPLRVTSSAGHENHPHRTDGHGIPTFTHRQAAIPSGRRGPEAVDLLAAGGEVGSGGRYPGCCVEAISCRGMRPDGQFAVPKRRPGLVPATGSPKSLRRA